MIPQDVPLHAHEEYSKNYQLLTKGTDRFFLFAADHKIEHLDKDFFGPSIPAAVHNPEHIFAIASQGRIGALATQLGLIARYGTNHTDVNYIVKLNSKTNIIPTSHKDPLSRQLWNVKQVIDFKSYSRLSICGIGLTVYLGSEYEDLMLNQAAQAVYEAHQYGLITILWMYPRGKYVQDTQDIQMVAGAAGVAVALGADFAKINPPHSTTDKTSAQLLKRAVEAAGNTKILCAGGKAQEPQQFLRELHEQLALGGTAGAGIGRNIYQHSLKEAIAMTQAISALIYDKAPLSTALNIL